MSTRSMVSFFEGLNEKSQAEKKSPESGRPTSKQVHHVSPLTTPATPPTSPPTTATTVTAPQLEAKEILKKKEGDEILQKQTKESSDQLSTSTSTETMSECSTEYEIKTKENSGEIDTSDQELAKVLFSLATNDKEFSDWSPNNMEIFQKPMCLISAQSKTNDEGEEEEIVLEIEEKTIQQIKQITWPMVVVAVAGLYRTGKSYLMNRLANSSKGFALGDTIESKTKGIWVWCKKHPKKENTVLLLLDTEGLGDVEKGDSNHDNKIFTLATLLSNCLVYNMKGAFDNDAVSKLTFVTEMAKNIRFRGESSDDNQTLNLVLPDFVLCLRDFSLKLMKGDRQLTENEYLEESLAKKKSKAEQFNKPRECIKKYFAKRECFAFPVPGDGNVLENLETLSFNDLSDRFKEVTTRFVSFIYSKPPKELLASKPINGLMFEVLVDRYVTAIKHGAVPDVDDAFTAAAKVENAKIEEKALRMFEEAMTKLTLPVTRDTLMDSYSKAQQEALSYLRKNVVLDKTFQHENKAKGEMDTIFSNMKKINREKVREECKTKLQEEYQQDLKIKIENRDYEKAGGSQRFRRDLEVLKTHFTSTLRDFDEIEIIWTWHGFVQELTETERKIVEADDSLTRKEKEEEQRRNLEYFTKTIKDQQRIHEEALEKQQKDMKNHYEKIEKERIEQQEKDRERYEALVKEKLEKEAAEKEIKRYQREKSERMNEWLPVRIWNAAWNYT